MTTYTTLISAQQLYSLQAQASTPVLIIDVRHDLSNPDAGRIAYASSRIPNAIYLNLETQLSGLKKGNNGRHPLPSYDAFKTLISSLGITPSTQVVCYDAQNGMFAARLWWMLKWLNHQAVAVLDGGWQHWQTLQYSVDSSPPASWITTRLDQTYCDTRDNKTLTIEDIQTNLKTAQYLVIDARSHERYLGQQEPIDSYAGHIPHAINRPCTDNLTPTGAFKEASRLHAEFEQLLRETPSKYIVHQCGSGVTACHNLLAMEHAGLSHSLLYPGSWSEWCSDPTRPRQCD